MKSVHNVEFGQFFRRKLEQLFGNQDKERRCVEAAQWEQTEDEVKELLMELFICVKPS